MKNKFKNYLYLFIALAFVFACEEDGPEVYNGQAFVSFTDQNGTLNVEEDSGSSEFTIGITKAFDTDVTVTLSVTDDTAVENADFILPSTTVVIPAGEYIGSFNIDPINDDVFNTPRAFSIEIVSVSSSQVNIGNENVDSYIKTVNIVNDDCPTQYSLWFGDLTVQDPGYPNIPATGDTTGDCDILLIDGDLSGFGAYSAPFELYFEPSFEGATNGTVNLPAQVYCTACSEGLDAVLTGSGTYDETTETIVLFWSLDRTDGASFGSGTHIITPN
ncbi:Calx-beta domain-containing protein [Winogradskyella sediminis]|uniref:Calx-beta domain-containing protein n=1 Tax=Winogradskyella sediminis TaxID=1382466 RepID=A0A1H1U9L5_9FLAO|nr:Calx-beta domain-containing protein [Winogradskyella sediminis]SDS68589.1 Calx-beta domain-containing protein [Winogradskyella sediminis]